MKKMNLLTLVLFVSFGFISNAQSYKAEAKSSILEWTGKKVTGEHVGTINLKSGDFIIKDNKIASGNFIVDMTSIVCNDLTDKTYNEKLVGHLKSDDFFGTETYPVATFKIKGSSKISNNTYKVYGDLTIKGITHPIEFEMVQQKVSNGLKMTGTVNVDRTKYNVRYGSGKFYERLGDNMIYDEFTIKMEVLAIK